MNSLVRFWLTPKFPRAQVNKIFTSRPSGLGSLISDFIKTWCIHPVKRRIAKYYLLFLQSFFDITIIGITGSAGKTTTKDMLASILKYFGETVYSYANIDPIYNIPSTILRCKPSTKYLVLEMGVEYPGEMDFYLWLAKPDVGIITNIYPTHTQYLGSISGVYKEKAKLFRGLVKGGYAILKLGDKYLDKVRVGHNVEVVRFGNGGNVRSSNERYTKDYKTQFSLISDYIPKKEVVVTIPILGKQFISDALAASACAIVLGVSTESIIKGLEHFSPQKHRMQVIKLSNGTIVIDDTYNNNPEAAKEALKTLAFFVRRKKILVFGDMLELGQLEKSAHIELGRKIADSKVDYLIGVGPLSKYLVQAAKRKLHNSSFWVSSVDEVKPLLSSLIDRETALLLKGSRAIGLDKIVSQLI